MIDSDRAISSCETGSPIKFRHKSGTPAIGIFTLRIPLRILIVVGALTWGLISVLVAAWLVTR
jgi:hypothetical protein